jgi:hypothetical protein
MTARVFLHELDHLDGIAHTSRANSYHLEQAKKLVKKIGRKYKVKPVAEMSEEAQQMLEWLKV